MARGRASTGGNGGAVFVCNRAIDRADDYKRDINKIHNRTQLMADQLTIGGDLEALLPTDDDASRKYLEEQRERLKKIAAENEKRVEHVEIFVKACKDARADVERVQNERVARQNAQANDGTPHIDEGEPADYERFLTEKVEEHRAAAASDAAFVPYEDREMANEVKKCLGEKVKKRSRASRGGDDDDDLELVEENRGADTENDLKCGITGMLYENPMKNKVCGHTYSKAGLEQMFRNNKHKCPVPGCTNNSVQWSQVEPDDMMVQRVERFQRRQQLAKREAEMISQANDDEEEEGEGVTML